MARKPAVPAIQTPAIAEALARHLARPINPGVVVALNKTGYSLDAPHRDQEGWEIQILDAFGTRSVSAARVFLDQLAGLCRPAIGGNGEWAPNEVDLNAMLAMVNSVRPRNEIEAALAAQMAAIHILTARIFGEAASVEGWVNPDKAALGARLAKTFAQQCETLHRLKGRVGRQSIKVKYERHNHQHVHVERPHGGVGEIPDQSRRPITGPALAAGAKMPGQNTPGDRLPEAGPTRQGEVFIPRRPGRRAER